MASKEDFDPPLVLGSDLFEIDFVTGERFDQNESNAKFEDTHHISEFEMPGHKLKIRQFGFHPTNANFVWHGNFELATWISQNKDRFEGKRILELGSATGILSIFLHKMGFEVVASDYNDPMIEENFHFNLELNDMASIIPFVRYCWGDPLPAVFARDNEFPFDIIIASDILIYVNQYPNLVNTLSRLIKPNVWALEQTNQCSLQTEAHIQESPHFIMCWNRHAKGEEEFFQRMESEGFTIDTIGKRIYDMYIP